MGKGVKFNETSSEPEFLGRFPGKPEGCLDMLLNFDLGSCKDFKTGVLTFL
jgi:hypothetical protein